MKLANRFVRIGGAPGGREAELAAATSDFLEDIATIMFQVHVDVRDFLEAVRLAARALEGFARVMEYLSYTAVVRRGIQALEEGRLTP